MARPSQVRPVVSILEDIPDDQLRPYFPRVGSRYEARANVRTLPDRTTTVGPVLDPEHAQKPIPAFDADSHKRTYSQISPGGINTAPPRPEQFSDKYLVPSLARDERLRLTVLWYHTRRIEQDQQLLSRIDAIAKTIQETIGWEFAIVGILDEAIYTRLATANLPIALLPRREATCAHTILQTPGTVFMSNDLINDWRFQDSPHVKIGQLRSYAGTQLLVTADDGQEVALGSLCVASNSIQTPLTERQRASLVRFAELLSWEITDRTRQLRFRERSQMMDTLLKLQAQTTHSDFQSKISETLQQTYPNTCITVQESASGHLELDGREDMSYSKTDSNLWEDTLFIEKAIRHSNYQRISADQVVRVVAARCGMLNHYIVVSSKDIHHVFDDVDAWFVDKCAAMLAEALQSRLLIQALEAKELFLRNITHQLRTPIHGILASVDLLSDEMISKSALISAEENLAHQKVESSPTAYVAAIRSSGRELMSTVNNILKFNTLTTQTRAELVADTRYDLSEVGPEILTEAMQLVSEEQMTAVSIKMENKLPNQQTVIQTDRRWIKDCLQPLLVNGLQSVLGSGCGVVRMTISYKPETHALYFDFRDTGIGIRSADQKRIFAAFEKVDDHKSGAGLGLTLARKIAEQHNGSISLIASVEGYGSHFQAIFRNQQLSASSAPTDASHDSLQNLPKTFRKDWTTFEYSHMLNHLADYLTDIGLVDSHSSNSQLIITDTSSSEKDVGMLHTCTGLPKVIICFVKDHNGRRTHRVSGNLAVLYVSGPFYTARLNSLLRRVNTLYADMTRPLNVVQLGPPQSDMAEETHVMTIAPIREDIEQPASTIIGIKNPIVRALLVDDNAINLRILEMFCQKRDIPYVTATDGLKAEEAFRKALKTAEPISLILMDLQMPVCNGIQATQLIRNIEIEQSLPRSSIFMVTGQDSPGDRSQSEQAGANEYLVKPVSMKILHRQIIKHFGDYTK